MRWILIAAGLCLALRPAPAARAESPRTWTVQAGDVLSTIAMRAGVSIDDLRRWNDLEGDRILVGQELVVNPPTEATSDGQPPSTRESANSDGTRDRSREAPTGPTVSVERGDTLSHIAHRMGVSVPEILAANPGLAPDRIRAGQQILVPERRRRVEHRVRRGETLSGLAARYEVTPRELARWNPGVRRMLRAGQTLVVHTDVPDSRSESVGATNGGQLLHGERLPPHRGYVIRDPARAYGTVETVRWIVEAFDAVREAHPNAPRVRVHDISYESGGRIPQHRSHQSGRDADMSYFLRRCPGGVCPMRRINPEFLDVERQWTLFRHWLSRGVVQAIFVDYELQQPLYDYARSEGATREELHRWFQYPRGRTYPLGIIRHFPKHRDHHHVRFVCPESDESCIGR